jgi:hypothetical protein
MSSVLEVLQSAIRDAATVSIIYNGGSRPGQSRLVIPLSVSTDELVAREPASRLAKTFKLQKVASAALATGEVAANLEAVPAPVMLAPVLNTFTEYAAHFRDFLKKSKFSIVEEENYFAIVGSFKNGKPRKTPSVSIQYIDRSIDSVLNFESGEIEEVHHELTGRERPWRVDSARMKEGKSFAQLPKAAELFLQEVQARVNSSNDA